MLRPADHGTPEGRFRGTGRGPLFDLWLSSIGLFSNHCTPGHLLPCCSAPGRVTIVLDFFGDGPAQGDLKRQILSPLSFDEPVLVLSLSLISSSK